MTFRDMRHEAGALLRLGMAFMASGFLTMGAAYAVKIIVVRLAGFEAAGLYHSSWTLGGLYVGFILQAMGTDFYPRLTAVSMDHPRCNQLVNQQALVSILLAGPGIIATLTFAPLVIALFYSAEFAAAVGVLRWICLGMMLRVIAWPMGFIVVAKGEQKIFIWTEIAATVVHVGLAWLLVAVFGVAGAGMAFFGLYVWHGVLIYVIVRRLSGFEWSAENRRTALLFLPLIGLVFVGLYVLPFWLATGLGTAGVLATGTYSARMLADLDPDGRVSRVVALLAWRRRR
jgi:PST family polysaccharide transporter